MVARADSELGALLTLLVLFGGFVGMLASIVLLVSRKFRASAKALFASVAGIGVYVVAVVGRSFRTLWVKLYIGNDASFLHKRTMLRVLWRSMPSCWLSGEQRELYMGFLFRRHDCFRGCL